MHLSSIDWNNDSHRKEYEEALEKHRDIRKNWSLCKNSQWFLGIILFPAFMVLGLYGSVAYYVVEIAMGKKINQENAMRLEWLEKNKTEILTEKMPNFEYYEPFNNFLINYYTYATLFSQGTAFLISISFAITDYKKWNLMGLSVAMLCLPIDFLVFYIEPLGFIGTLSAMVLGFVPYIIPRADAMFPEYEEYVKLNNGKIIKMKKNSWQNHMSLTHNQRYNLVMRVTWAGYSFFATVALVTALFQGESQTEFYLGIAVCLMEGLPQFLHMQASEAHWHDEPQITALDFLVYFLDVPLVLWYLTFYSNERLHLAVIGKVLFLAIENCSGYWAAFMETYIYDEKPAEVTLEETKSEVMSSKFEYHPSKLWLVCLYHIVYVLISPLIGLKEIAIANKVAGRRDAGFIEQAKITPLVVEEDESKGSTH